MATEMPLDDPMFKFAETMAHSERGFDNAASSAEASRPLPEAGPTKAEVKEALERKKLELEAKKLRDQEANLERKQRDEQMKQFARVAKAAGDAEAERANVPDTPEKREELLRQIGLMREMLGTPGTRKRCDASTPLQSLLSELSIMHTQANLERAAEAPKEAFFWAVEAAETVCSPYYDFRGAAVRIEDMYEKSKAATSPMERRFYSAMLQCSIKYSSYFEMGPEMYLAFTVGNVIKEQAEENKMRGYERRERAVESEIDAEFDRVWGETAGVAEEVAKSK